MIKKRIEPYGEIQPFTNAAADKANRGLIKLTSGRRAEVLANFRCVRAIRRRPADLTCGKLIRRPLTDRGSIGSTTCDRISRGLRTSAVR
jgi:hypothetical protein